jgi:tetratricopeptide (TPR) repeat protein
VSAEAQVRFDLESGRTLASAAHSPSSQNIEDLAQARFHYQRAVDRARIHRLDALHIDALHMFGFVETEPALQRAWAEKALDVALASDQGAAQKWQASLRNNIGYALHQEGRFDEALSHFEAALVLREARGDANATGVARWMVAWTLRSLKRFDEALAIQTRLERQYDVAGAPSVYVYQELAALYLAQGKLAQSESYAAKAKALAQAGPST